MERSFSLCQTVCASADPALNNPSFLNLWKRFCLENCDLTINPGEPNTFCMGDAAIPALPEGKEYVLSVNRKLLHRTLLTKSVPILMKVIIKTNLVLNR